MTFEDLILIREKYKTLERAIVSSYLEEMPSPYQIKVIARDLGVSSGLVRRIVHDFVDSQKLQKVGNRFYKIKH